MLTLFLAVIAAVTFGTIGTVTGLAIGHRTVPDLRASDGKTIELMWHRVGAILATVAVLATVGTFGFWLAGRIFTSVEHPALTSCQDYALPPAAMAQAVHANASPNLYNQSLTYTLCRIAQH